jgi:hypothetical protein
MAARHAHVGFALRNNFLFNETIGRLHAKLDRDARP